ncbi:MAG: thioredoxin domain-containing protein, partial [Bacteroidetes bacterium]|nr:thioredoxin domain-containing protein [Bacteroidota bacterium]
EDPSEQGEGAFYVWTREEIVRLLQDQASVFCYHYGVEESGNVSLDPQQEFTGRNILYRARSEEESARFAGCTVDELRARLAASRRKLFESRLTRPRPLRDDKVLTSWNGLVIGALARAGSILEAPAYLYAAEKGGEFIFSSLYDVWGGVLKRRYREGEARHEAHLDDYAFLCNGVLALYAATGDPKWLERAIDLTTTQVALFWDDEGGGFFETSGRDPSVLVRMKERYDGAEPSGNSVAAENLALLSGLTGNADWHEKAERIFRMSSPWLQRQPSIMPYMVAALLAQSAAGGQLVITGAYDDPRTAALRREFATRFLPATVILHIGDEMQRERLARIVPAAAHFHVPGDEPAAHLCENFTCRLPVTTPADLGVLLDALKHRDTIGKS